MQVVILDQLRPHKPVYIKLEYNNDGTAEVVVCDEDGIREYGGHLLRISESGVTFCKAVNKKFGFALDSEGYLIHRKD